MHWGIGSILVALFFVFPASSCENGDVFVLHGESLKVEDSQFLRLAPHSERYGLWLAAEYEGQRAIAIGRYISSAHFFLDRRLQRFFGAPLTFQKNSRLELNYLGGGEFLAVNRKNHTAIAEVVAVHDSCGFLKGKHSKYKDMENDPSVFIELTPDWLSGNAEKKRVRDGISHLNPLLANGVDARHDLLKPAYVFGVISQQDHWEQRTVSASEIRQNIRDERVNGRGLIELGLMHAALLREEGFDFAPEGTPDGPKMLRESDFARWEAYLGGFNRQPYALDDLKAMCRLGKKVHDSVSEYGSKVAGDIEIFVP
ncbi:MAG: hypothetical protein KDD51_01185 [Bdellovibrionales bacterium]|nr:hypothetical protein [Bdellovibrionales bacterium]